MTPIGQGRVDDEICKEHFCDPNSRIVIEDSDDIARILVKWIDDPSVREDIVGKVDPNLAKLYCRMCHQGMVPWTLAATSTIAIDALDEGLFYVGKAPIKKVDWLGFYDGR